MSWRPSCFRASAASSGRQGRRPRESRRLADSGLLTADGSRGGFCPPAGAGGQPSWACDRYLLAARPAGVAKLVDARDLKSCALRRVRVRVPPPAPPSFHHARHRLRSHSSPSSPTALSSGSKAAEGQGGARGTGLRRGVPMVRLAGRARRRLGPQRRAGMRASLSADVSARGLSGWRRRSRRGAGTGLPGVTAGPRPAGWPPRGTAPPPCLLPHSGCR